LENARGEIGDRSWRNYRSDANDLTALSSCGCSPGGRARPDVQVDAPVRVGDYANKPIAREDLRGLSPPGAPRRARDC